MGQGTRLSDHCIVSVVYPLIFGSILRVSDFLSSIGIYILMFLNIFYTFWKLIILTALLVIAFSLSFYMVFNEPGILFSRSPFADPARSILKTMTMITGELDFDAIFKQTPGGVLTADDVPGQVPFPEVSYMLWIIFLILMPILLSNLLVCPLE